MAPGATQYITPRALLRHGAVAFHNLFNYRAEQLPVSKRVVTTIYLNSCVLVFPGHGWKIDTECFEKCSKNIGRT